MRLFFLSALTHLSVHSKWKRRGLICDKLWPGINISQFSPIFRICLTGAGPKDACAQLVDFYGRTWFTPMPKFPRETFVEVGHLSPVHLEYVHTSSLSHNFCLRISYYYVNLVQDTAFKWRNNISTLIHSRSESTNRPFRLTMRCVLATFLIFYLI